MNKEHFSAGYEDGYAQGYVKGYVKGYYSVRVDEHDEALQDDNEHALDADSYAQGYAEGKKAARTGEQLCLDL